LSVEERVKVCAFGTLAINKPSMPPPPVYGFD
jgi:hypothetical protein